MPASDADPQTASKRLPRPAVRAVIWLALLAAIILGARWSRIVESLVFFAPSTAAFATPGGIEDVVIPTDRGELHAWWLPPEGEQLGTILFCHGNAGNLPDHLAFVDRLPAAGFGVLLFDYRGFGRSESLSRVTRETLLADSRAAMRHLLTERDVDQRRFGIIGHSMGGVMAVNIAAASPSETPVAAVAPFASFPRVASDHGSVLGLMLIAGGRSPERNVREFGDRPLLLIHGTDDQIVKSRHSERIARAARDAGVSTEAHLIDGADHVSVFDPPANGQQLAIDFFQRHFAADDSAAAPATVPGPPQ